MRNRILFSAFLFGCIVLFSCNLADPQTPPDNSVVPWDKISGKIAFVNVDEGKYSNRRYIYLIDSQDRSVKKVITSSDIYFDDATISSRGDQVAYSGTGGLNVLHVNDGSVNIHPDSYTPSYSRSNELVYHYVNGTVREIRKNGIKMNIPFNPISRIAFGPNDNTIVFAISVSDSSSRLVKYNILDSTYQLITVPQVGDTSCRVDSPDISPDGQKLLYSKSFYHVRRWSEIWIVNIDGSNDHKMLGNRNMNYNYPMWSPSGTYFVCSALYSPDQFDGGYSVNKSLWLFDLSTESAQSLININGYYSSWSK